MVDLGGCGIVLNFGGSFSDFTVFFIYLGGMLVVFGYMTATEQYPAVWVSNIRDCFRYISFRVDDRVFSGILCFKKWESRDCIEV